MYANLHINAIIRSGGRSTVGALAYRFGSAVSARSVVACASYRSGEVLKDERYEKTHDFTRKENVLHSEIIPRRYARVDEGSARTLESG